MRLAMIIDKRVQPSPQQMAEEKLKWSKLEFAFYVKGKNGFTSVSQPTCTDIIQESKKILSFIVILFHLS